MQHFPHPQPHPFVRKHHRSSAAGGRREQPHNVYRNHQKQQQHHRRRHSDFRYSRPVQSSGDGNIVKQGQNTNTNTNLQDLKPSSSAASRERERKVAVASSSSSHGGPVIAENALGSIDWNLLKRAQPPSTDASHKKPRLGWGEGLAKYEKKKVGEPVIGSPAKPAGIGEKVSVNLKTTSVYKETSQSSPSIMSQTHFEGPTFNLDNLNPAKLRSWIKKLLQTNKSSSMGLMNKLREWKIEALKTIEETESKIDSLETELKLLLAEPRCMPSNASSKMVEEHVGGFVNLSSDEPCLNDDNSRVNVPKGSTGDIPNLSGVDNVFYNSILASNKDLAKRASDELNKSLPAKLRVFDFSRSFKKISPKMKQKLLGRRQSQKFNERVAILKYKVFHRFWKERRVLSVRKLLGKSREVFHHSTSSCKKNHLTGCSHTSCSGGSHQVVPVEEVIDCVNGLLLESRFKFKPCRDTLKMPTLILDKGVKTSRFISNNSLVEDPCAVEKERSMINPWTAEEREMFFDKFSVYGKDFGKISSCLEHKTTADCVEFYYKNHKSEWFQRVGKKPEFAKQSSSQSTRYLVATRKRQNQEANRAGANDGLETQQTKCVPSILSGTVLNCGSLSSKATSSCTTTSFDRVDECQKASSGISTLDVTLEEADDECSDVSCGEIESMNWTDKEKSTFIQAMSSYGKDFTMISQVVGSRSEEQCKLHFSKVRKSLGLEQIHSSVLNDANKGDNSDNDVVSTSVSEVEIGEGHSPQGEEVCCESGTVETRVKICGENRSLCPQSVLENDPQMDDNPAVESTDGRLEPRSEPVLEVENVNDSSSLGDASGVGDNKVTMKVEDGDANSIEVAAASESDLKSDPQLVRNSLSLQVESGCQKEVDHKAVPAGKLPVISLHQNGQSGSLDLSLPFSIPEKHHEDSSSNGMGEKRSQGIPSSGGDCWEQLPSSFQLDKILREYPATLVQRVREITNGKVNCKQNILTSSQQQGEIVRPSSFWPQEQSSIEDNSSRPRVKLFGKVIISDSCQQATANNGSTNQSGNLRCNGDCDQRMYSGHSLSNLGPLPITQMRFPPLPNSTQVLAKYPTVFHNRDHYTPLITLNQQQQQPQTIYGSVSNNNYRQITTTSRPQLATDYQALRNEELQRLQEAAFLSEMQRRSKLYVMPPNQARGMMLGTYNSATAGGLAVSGVFDPVAAMKMHYEYARAQRLRMQTRNATGEPGSNENAGSG